MDRTAKFILKYLPYLIIVEYTYTIFKQCVISDMKFKVRTLFNIYLFNNFCKGSPVSAFCNNLVKVKL